MNADIKKILEKFGLVNITPYELYNLMENDLLLFSRVILPRHLQTGEIPEFHKEIYEILQKEKRLTAIGAPRDHAKTTLLTIYAIHQILYGKVKHVLYISETSDMAKDQLATIKEELLHNPRIRLFWGELQQVQLQVSSEIDFEYYDKVEKARITQELLEINVPVIQKNGTIRQQACLVRARGTGQQIRGRKRGITRPDLIIADDLESEKNVSTVEARLKTKKWWGNACRLSLADNGRAIMIANYVHEDCLIKNLIESKMIKGNKAYEVALYRIITNYDENDPNFDWNKAEPLWPVRKPVWKILQLMEEFRAEDNIEGFWSELMNICVTSERRYFKRRNYYDGEYINRDGGYMNITRRDAEKVDDHHIKVSVHMGCDPAVGKSSGADYFTIVPVAVDIYDNLYKLPSFAKRSVGPKEAEDELVAYCREYSEALRYLAIEKNGFQEYLVYNLKKRFQKENLNVRIIPIENRSAKTGPKRIGMLVPINEEGRFWIKETDQLIKEEMHGYPNAKHEHLLDGTQIGIRFRRKPVYHTTGQEQIQKRRQKREKQEYNWMTSTVRTRKSA